MADLIRVEVYKQTRPGIYAYMVPSLGLSGRSRQPLLAACRKIKSTLGETAHISAAIYWPGKEDWAAKCDVDWGAAHSVQDSELHGPRFRLYRERPGDTDQGEDGP